jgi:hypothetical protein
MNVDNAEDIIGAVLSCLIIRAKFLIVFTRNDSVQLVLSLA